MIEKLSSCLPEQHGVADLVCTTQPSLQTCDLDGSVCEYTEVFGFKLVRHVPHAAALLEYGSAQVHLVEIYPQHASPTLTLAAERAPHSQQIAVEGIFDLYARLTKRVRHKLSSPPKLNMLGSWAFAMTDSQNNVLCFVQSIVRTALLARNSQQT